jgi:hypothetical protein
MKPVRITKLAQTEIDDAASWFERRKQGLGIEFYQRWTKPPRRLS